MSAACNTLLKHIRHHALSILEKLQKRHPYTGDVDSKAPGDSQNVFLHLVDSLAFSSNKAGLDFLCATGSAPVYACMSLCVPVCDYTCLCRWHRHGSCR